MEVLLENAVEIKRSKRLKGQPTLQGDGLTGFQALLMGALAEGPTKLENLPDSPWFRDIMQDFIRMGYAQQSLDGHWTIHGGNAPVSGPEPLRVRHEAELLTLAGFLAAKECRRSLAIDPACVSGEAMELLGRILKLESAPELVKASDIGLAEAAPISASAPGAAHGSDEAPSSGEETGSDPDPYAEENARIVGDEGSVSASAMAMDLLDADDEDAMRRKRAKAAKAARDAEREAAAARPSPAQAYSGPAPDQEFLLMKSPTGLTYKTAAQLHPGGAAAAVCKPAEFGWDEYQAKLALLSFHLASGQSLDLSLSKSGPDWLETLAAQFGGPVRVEKNEAPEGDELARRIARQMRAAGKTEPQTRIRLGAGAKLKPQTYTIPADIALASAYCLAATLIKGSDVTLENVPLNPSRAGFISALRRMGADIEVVSRRERNGEGLGLLRVRSAELFGKRFAADNHSGMRDEIFLLMVAASYAEGETVLRDVTYLRKHDVDLLKGFTAALKSAGVEIGEIEDGVVIRGRPDYDGSAYDCMGHPGLALAGMVMGLKSHGASTLRGAGCLDGRYPGLLDQMALLGAGDKT
ncbi:MAG: aroA [Fibrobacteres bacterium]|nr:aroA [Fibrobacterota bacterium]